MNPSSGSGWSINKDVYRSWHAAFQWRVRISDIPCRGKSSIQEKYGSWYSMYTLRVRNPIPLHTSVFLKNTGSYRLISGPWHNSFHTVRWDWCISYSVVCMSFCPTGPLSLTDLLLLCFLIKGNQASGLSILLSPLMLLECSLMWISSFTLCVLQWGSRSVTNSKIPALHEVEKLNGCKPQVLQFTAFLCQAH